MSGWAKYSGAVECFWGSEGLEACLVVLGSAVMLALYAYATIHTGNPKAGFVASAVLYLLAAASSPCVRRCSVISF